MVQKWHEKVHEKVQRLEGANSRQWLVGVEAILVNVDGPWPVAGRRSMSCHPCLAGRGSRVESPEHLASIHMMWKGDGQGRARESRDVMPNPGTR